MKRFLAGAAIFLPACMRTVVDVGPASGSLTDGGTTGNPSRWKGNESNCPTNLPASTNDDVCDIREGQSCTFASGMSGGRDMQTICTCYEKDRTTKLWYCGPSYENTGCPAVEPASETDCFGSGGSNCVYPPSTTCNCPHDDPNLRWSCPGSRLPPGAPTSAPAEIPENRRVKDLSDAEART
jgi:hypothetical protein